MNKHSVLVFSVLLICGCASVETAVNQFKKVDYADGISRQEAQLIAQNHLIESRYRGSVDVLKPLNIMNQETSQYPHYWFVTFPTTDYSSPLTRYLIVVDKRTAAIIREAWWNTSQKPGVQWIFEKGKVTF